MVEWELASPPRSVVIVDDHSCLRLGLRRTLELSPQLQVVGEAGDGEEALAVVRQLRPDLVVMDLSLPLLNGLEVMRRLRGELPAIKFVAYSLREEAWAAREALEAGAAAYVCKNSPPSELLRAVEQAAITDAVPAAQKLEKSSDAPEAPRVRRQNLRLSEREAHVLRLLARGVTLKEAARSLQISVRTLETYRARGMQKLQLRTRVDLMRFAEHSGWLSAPEEEAAPRFAPTVEHESANSELRSD
ncbi:MAG: response regulator transcription factor [Myxococcales bacterium]|nr:MAG: response regulator transcription factor [Myxococcales bacterium]